VQAIIREFERRPPLLVGDAGGETSTTHQRGENSRTIGSVFSIIRINLKKDEIAVGTLDWTGDNELFVVEHSTGPEL
jgi:hypothetical protein